MPIHAVSPLGGSILRLKKRMLGVVASVSTVADAGRECESPRSFDFPHNVGIPLLRDFHRRWKTERYGIERRIPVVPLWAAGITRSDRGESRRRPRARATSPGASPAGSVHATSRFPRRGTGACR